MIIIIIHDSQSPLNDEISTLHAQSNIILVSASMDVCKKLIFAAGLLQNSFRKNSSQIELNGGSLSILTPYLILQIVRLDT